MDQFYDSDDTDLPDPVEVFHLPKVYVPPKPLNHNIESEIQIRDKIVKITTKRKYTKADFQTSSPKRLPTTIHILYLQFTLRHLTLCYIQQYHKLLAYYIELPLGYSRLLPLIENQRINQEKRNEVQKKKIVCKMYYDQHIQKIFIYSTLSQTYLYYAPDVEITRATTDYT